eukprot:m.39453 g.39453  ORF g.39453 m.39453 type:complete len:280 (+) comp9555_c0_seq4:113-952(+)
MVASPRKPPHDVIPQSPVLAKLSGQAQKATKQNSSTSPSKYFSPVALKGLGSRSALRAINNNRNPSPTWSGLKKPAQSKRQRTSNYSRPSKLPPWESPKEKQIQPTEWEKLARVLVEIEPPYGVIRLPFNTMKDIENIRVCVNSCITLINIDLPKTCEQLQIKSRGLVFQALLKEAAKECKKEDQKTDGALYIDREDRSAGEAIDLHKLRNSKVVVADMTKKTTELIKLLRIKIEDDGDLQQAGKTLRDCSQFFDKLRELATADGVSIMEGLEKLRKLI